MNFLKDDKMDKIKVGVIGTGYWGKKHVYEYSQLKEAELSWICDLDKKILNTLKKDHNVPNVTSNFKDVLTSDVEAVSICSNNENHYKLAKEALLAGKHVLLEKPMTTSSKTSQELVDIAKKANRQLAVGHIFRFNNGLSEVKKLIKKGYFGDIYFLRLQWTTVLSPTNPIDVILDLCPHTFDIMNYLLDEWPEKITCTGKAYRKKNLEDVAFIMAEFKNGITAHTEVSWLLPGKVRELYVIGSKRSANIECLSQKVIVFEDGKEKDLNITTNNTIGSELSHFLDSIKRGSKLSNDGEIGTKTLQLIEAAKESLKKGKTIEI